MSLLGEWWGAVSRVGRVRISPGVWHISRVGGVPDAEIGRPGGKQLCREREDKVTGMNCPSQNNLKAELI